VYMGKGGMALDTEMVKGGGGRQKCGLKDKRGNCNENEDPGRGVEHLN
jgi:hypothetical protein